MTAASPDEEIDRLRAILDCITDAVVLCKYDRRVDDAVCVWCNRATLHATGLSREEIVGFPPRKLLPIAGDLEDAATRRRLFDAVRAQGVLELERPLGDPALPGTRLRIRVFSPGPESDLYVLQTEPITANGG